MSPITVSVGEHANWVQPLVSAILPALVAALAALGGIYLSDRSAERRRREDAKERDAERGLHKGLAALAVAEHLEDFVLHCVDVVTSANSISWQSPYEEAEYSDPPLWLKALPAWPERVDWKQVGLNLAVRAANFHRKVQFSLEGLRSSAEHLDSEDMHGYHAEEAAKLGLDAWAIAVDVRIVGDLDPFVWPEDWNGIEVLRAYRDKRANREKANQETLVL